MDHKAGGGLRDMTERDALLAARDELARTPRGFGGQRDRSFLHLREQPAFSRHRRK